MSKHRPSLFWPIVLIGVGVIFLLSNTGVITGNPWPIILNLWPVVLIVIGLDILFGHRSAAGSLISAALALVLVVGVILLLVGNVNFGAPLQTRHIEEPLGEVRSAHVSIDFGTGRNQLYALGDSSQLIEGDLSYFGTLHFDPSTSGDRADIRLERSGSISLGFIGGTGEQWDIGLNQRPSYELDLSLGVGESNVDLSRLTLTDSRINVGVGATDVRLPSTGRFTLRIDGGVGEVRVRIPRQVAVRAEVDTGIGAFNAGSRLRAVGDGVYETEGFGAADDRVTLQIDVGVGTITIIDE
jgi:hypothetical protein